MKIVNAAWELFYENGYENTTIEDIVERSETSKGSFYHHFSGKDALLSTLSYHFDDKYEALEGGIDALIQMYGAVGHASAPIQQKPFATPDMPMSLAYGNALVIDGTTFESTPFELYTTNGAVHAKAAGRVVHVGESELLGKFVILDHGCGLYTWYCGLSDVHVSTSKPVVGLNDSLGIAGSAGLGLAGETNVLIIATLGRTAISPAYLREHAIILN